MSVNVNCRFNFFSMKLSHSHFTVEYTDKWNIHDFMSCTVMLICNVALLSHCCHYSQTEVLNLHQPDCTIFLKQKKGKFIFKNSLYTHTRSVYKNGSHSSINIVSDIQHTHGCMFVYVCMYVQ